MIENDLNVNVRVEHGGNPRVEVVNTLLIAVPLVENTLTTDSGSENLQVVTVDAHAQASPELFDVIERRVFHAVVHFVVEFP